MAEAQIIRHGGAIPASCKIKLIKGQKDTYGWEISVSDDSLDTILYKLAEADAALKSTYGGQGA